MHASLQHILQQTIDTFESDPRVLAAWMIGSAMSESEDNYSDVDPMFIIQDHNFHDFDKDLPQIFRNITDKIILWWPERGNNDVLKNYAILFKSNGSLLQYDINIMRESAFCQSWLMNVSEKQILFDKKGLLKDVMGVRPLPSYNPEKLLYNIELFWLYAYILTKYLLRNQTFKIIYAQGVFFECHMEVLHALHSNDLWNWWPINIHKLFNERERISVYRYFANTSKEAVISALPSEVEDFSNDAKLACQIWGIDYPAMLEYEIINHMKNANVLRE